jgi:hypothetical protein
MKIYLFLIEKMGLKLYFLENKMCIKVMKFKE